MTALKQHVFPFLILIALLFTTVLGAFLPLGVANIFISLAISICKAWVVYFFFMELRTSSTIIRVMGLVGVVWLIIMLTLASTDYFTRWPGVLQHS